MAQDKTIAQLEPRVIDDITTLLGLIYVPTSIGGVNYRVDLGALINSIKDYIQTVGVNTLLSLVGTAIATYLQTHGINGGGSSSGEGGGGEGTTPSTDYSSAITALLNRLSVLESDLTWPKHTIILSNGTSANEIVLETRPNGDSKLILITSSSITNPLWQAKVSLNLPNISGGYIIGDIKGIIQGSDTLNNTYSGGMVNKVEFSISYLANNLTFTVNNGNYILAYLENTQDTAGMMVSPNSSGTWRLNLHIPESHQTILDSMTVKMRINEMVLTLTVSAGRDGANTTIAQIYPES